MSSTQTAAHSARDSNSDTYRYKKRMHLVSVNTFFNALLVRYYQSGYSKGQYSTHLLRLMVSLRIEARTYSQFTTPLPSLLLWLFH